MGRGRWHVLKDNKRTGFPRRWVFFDTETYQPTLSETPTRMDFRLGWACYVRIREDFTKVTERWKKIGEIGDFWNFVETLAKDNTRLMLVAHNVGFDFNVLAGYLELPKRGWELVENIVTSNVFIMRWKKGKKVVVIIDFLQIMRFGLRQIGEFIGLEKLEVDFKNVDDETLSEYCKRDVEILKNAMLWYLKFLKDNDLGNFAFTLSGQSLNAYRHRFMTHEIKIHDCYPAVVLERDSYKGGRTEAFYIGKVDEDIYYLDVNSMYPFVMREYEYPYEFVAYRRNVTIEQLKQLLERFCVIADVTIRTNKPAIGYKDERLIFPIGRFRTALTTAELKWVLENGEIHKVHRLAYYKKGYIFKKWVNEIYAMRERYKKEGNVVGDKMLKLLLNSLYGKFGQRYKTTEFVGDTDYNNVGAMFVYDVEEKQKYFLRFVGGKAYREIVTDDNAYNSFVGIASHVTAYARMHLWNIVERAGLDNVFYCDTDSVMVNEKGYERLKNLIHPTRLGALKLEGVSDDLFIRGAKDYVFMGKEKIKGVSKTWQRVDENTYRGEQILKTRSLIRNGTVDGVYIKLMEKQLRREYKKGVVGEDGRVRPFVLG